jgi:citrate synthase
MAEDVQIYKGLQGVVIDESSLSFIDGAAGKLLYAGYKIEDLAANAKYEEIVFLLWNGKLPTKAELEALRQDIASQAALPDGIINMLKATPKDANAMAVLRTATSALAYYDADAEDLSPEALRRSATRLAGQMTNICATWVRIRGGKEPIAPREDLWLAENFIHMLKGEVDDAAADAINAYMVLLTEHGMNASTFTSRVVSSTMSDIYSAITAGIGALKGALHGGANTAAMDMFIEIGEVENVDSWFDKYIATKERRIMGIGHRVYKALDPRAAVLRERAEALAASSGNAKWYDIAVKLAERARSDSYFIDRNLFPNVDYYSAIVLYTLGLDTDMFTPLFAMSRIAGWSSHVIEQLGDNKLMRPKVQYTGAFDLEYVRLEDR